MNDKVTDPFAPASNRSRSSRRRLSTADRQLVRDTAEEISVPAFDGASTQSTRKLDVSEPIEGGQGSVGKAVPVTQEAEAPTVTQVEGQGSVSDEKPLNSDTEGTVSGDAISPIALPWEVEGFIGVDHKGKPIKQGYSPKIDYEAAEMLRWLREDEMCIKSQISFIEEAAVIAIKNKVVERLMGKGLSRSEAKKRAGITYK